jgi:hypothetical protein
MIHDLTCTWNSDGNGRSRWQEIWALEATLLEKERSSARRIVALQHALDHLQRSSARRIDVLMDELAETNRELEDVQEALALAKPSKNQDSLPFPPLPHPLHKTLPARPPRSKNKPPRAQADGDARISEWGKFKAVLCMFLFASCCIAALLVRNVTNNPKDKEKFAATLAMPEEDSQADREPEADAVAVTGIGKCTERVNRTLTGLDSRLARITKTRANWGRFWLLNIRRVHRTLIGLGSQLARFTSFLRSWLLKIVVRRRDA